MFFLLSFSIASVCCFVASEKQLFHQIREQELLFFARLPFVPFSIWIFSDLAFSLNAKNVMLDNLTIEIEFFLKFPLFSEHFEYILISRSVLREWNEMFIYVCIYYYTYFHHQSRVRLILRVKSVHYKWRVKEKKTRKLLLPMTQAVQTYF